MKTEMKKLEDGTIEFTITVPWKNILEEYKVVLAEKAKNVELAGFRKGKAPIDIVEKNLDKNVLYEEVLKHVLPELYQKAVTDYKIRPIMQPHIELKEAKENTDWTIVMKTCEQPKVDLGTYKEKLKLTKGNAKQKIWVPGKDDPKEQQDKI